MIQKGMKYRIAGMVCEVSHTMLLSEERADWNRFRCEEDADSLWSISNLELKQCQYGLDFFQMEKAAVHVVRSFSGILLANKDWSRGEVLAFGNQTLQPLIVQMFYSNAVWRRFLMLHSSLISIDGNGILFLGPSVLGKQRRRALGKYRNARIITGIWFLYSRQKTDLLDGEALGMDRRRIVKMPMYRFVHWCCLKQDLENRVRRLQGFELVSSFANSVYYPLWLEKAAEFCMELLDQLLQQIPVLELACRPDEDAVCLLQEELIKNEWDRKQPRITVPFSLPAD